MNFKNFGNIPFAKSRNDIIYYQEIRKLYENIILEFPDSHILVFTSKNQDAGKSTITEELAYMFAKDGYKVLAIDGDPHNPTLFGHILGVTEYINDIASLEEIFSNVGKVDFLCSGEKPMGVINPPSMDKIEILIQKARELYDYVLIDTPPLNIFQDACTYAKFCEGVILVQPIFEDTSSESNSMADSLLKDLPVIGTVMNHPKKKFILPKAKQRTIRKKKK